MIPPPSITIEPVAQIAALSAEWDPLFAAGPGVQSRRAWYEATEAAAIPPGGHAHYLTARQQGHPVALIPMLEESPRSISSLTSPYSVHFQPLLAPDADIGTDLDAVGTAMGQALRRWPLIRLEALDPRWPGLPPLLAGLRRAGFIAQRFDHFGNWHEDVAGLDWPAYLARRPGALRETIRRRSRAAAKDPTIRLEIVRGPEGLEAAMAAYEDVYARSWKVPEPFPRFNAALLPRMADIGALRLGLMWQAGRPLAAQYWTVLDGAATVLKLAHDDAAKALSPGTVLTAHVIQELLHEGVDTLDFGRGDDDYKRLWATTRQQRIGVLLANPWRPPGLAALARQWAGTLVRRLRRR